MAEECSKFSSLTTTLRAIRITTRPVDGIIDSAKLLDQ